jgi:uncharacterized protein
MQLKEARVWSVLAAAVVMVLLVEYTLRGFTGPAVRLARLFYPVLLSGVAGLILHQKFRPALESIGWHRPVTAGAAVGMLGALPMGLVLAMTHNLSATALADPLRLLETSLGAALREETFFRGLIFINLWRHSRLKFKGAMLVSALLFGAAHLPGQWQTASATSLLGIAVLTAAGGAFYAWLVAQWQSLWLAISLHAGMNLFWSLFAVGSHAAASGSTGQTSRIVTIVFMVVITELRRRKRERADSL